MSYSGRLKTFALAAVVTAAIAGPTGGAMAQDRLPGEGKSIDMARATWDTGWFQAALYKRALEDLGYDVGRLTTLDNPPFYQSVGQGDIDLWVNGWFPLHETYRDAFEPGATTIGHVAKGGALQGYLVDKASAEKYEIKGLSDFRREEVRKAFDKNNNGKAEMVACPPGWGCEEQIAKHLEEFNLTDVIEPVKASYAASMAEAISQYRAGEPILFYTWTPNWTVGTLEPGKDVVWIQTPEAGPDETVSGLTGCVADPCKLGWVANDIQPVANKKFLEENPAVRTLLESMSVPLDDIFAQNVLLNKGEDDPEDISRHVQNWIDENSEKYQGWIEAAKKAAS